MLDKMMEAINLNRNKVYISNVVNYRPPSNRKPTEEEIERYLPYLKTRSSRPARNPDAPECYVVSYGLGHSELAHRVCNGNCHAL